MKAIGYDYGTTTSWMAVYGSARNTTLLKSKPSAAMVKRNGNEITYGTNAILASDGEGSFVSSPKRYLVEKNCEMFRNRYSCELHEIIKGFSLDMLDHNLRIPLQGEDVHVTVTMPNCYDGRQMNFMRHCMEEAFGQRCRSYKIHLLPEPVAAALYYCLKTNIPNGIEEKTYIVTCDIGGGTTDLAAIFLHRKKEQGGKYQITFRVEATQSDGSLGGNDIDKLMMARARNELANGRFANEVETAQQITRMKETLSSENSTSLKLTRSDGEQIDFFMMRGTLERDLDIENDNSFCERLKRLIDELKNQMEQQYQTAGYGHFDWSKAKLLPVGGSMRTPKLREQLRANFPLSTMCELPTEAPDTYNSVAYGAMCYSAVKADLLPAIKIAIEGRTLHPISVEVVNRCLVPLVSANMPDGEYYTDSLRPLYIDGNDTFRIDSIRLFLTDDKEAKPADKPDYEISLSVTLNAHGREADDIPIRLTVTIEHSEISSVRVSISGAMPNGTDYETVVSKDHMNHKNNKNTERTKTCHQQ